MNRWLRYLPLLVLLAFVGAVAWRLNRPAEERIPSQLVGRTVPTFALAPIVSAKPGLTSADLAKGRPHMVNVFASWCVPCIAEAPLLLELKRRGVAIDAIAVRDKPEDVADFIGRYGDPFDRIGSDSESRVQLALGSSGVPESFIVDGQGVVRYQHMGPIESADLPTILREWAAAK